MYISFCTERSLVNEVIFGMSDKRIAIGELWRKVNHGVHDRFRQAFKETEMPFSLLIMLRQISKHPGATVSEVARHTGMVKSHISKSVEQMVSQGLVEKRPDPQDQRLQRLYLTEGAQKTAAQMEAFAHRAWLQVVEEVSDEDLDQVQKGFQILLDALERTKAKTDKDQLV